MNSARDTPSRSDNRSPLFFSLVLIGVAFAAMMVTADPTPSMSRKLFGLWRGRDILLPVACVFSAGALLAVTLSRNALLGYLASSITIFACVAMLEFVGLVGLVSWPSLLVGPHLTTGSPGWERAPNLDVSGSSVQDMSTSWGLPAESVNFRYVTDRRGYRNHVDRAGAEVYLLGDSIVVAALVPFEQTVTALVESRLGVPVMQLALQGIGPQEQHQLFREAQLDVRGRVVLQFIFEGNDLLDSRRARVALSSPSPERPTPMRDRSFSNSVLLVLQRWTQPVHGAVALRTCEIGSERYAFGWVRDSFIGHEDEMTHITVALESFAAEVQALGGRFAVVFVPTKLRVLGPQCKFPTTSEISDYHAHLSPLREHLVTWSSRVRIPTMDLTEPLQESARSTRVPWFTLDTHWNDIGHEVAATALAKWIRAGTPCGEPCK